MKSIEFQRKKLIYLEQLRDQNPDTYGFIIIKEGTSVNYPLFSQRIISTTSSTASTAKSNTGTIFVDFNNSRKVEENRALSICGHNMLNGSMFHDIARYDLNFPDKYGSRYDGSLRRSGLL